MEYGPHHLGRQLFGLVGHIRSKVVVEAADANNQEASRDECRTPATSSTMMHNVIYTQ